MTRKVAFVVPWTVRSATAKFCEFCATSMHTEVNILHSVEILKVRKLV